MKTLDSLSITNEIWRYWDDRAKGTLHRPMSWTELRRKVDEYIKVGKDPLELKKLLSLDEWETKKGETPTAPWPNMLSDAEVEEKEIPLFSPAMLDLVERAWKTKEAQRMWEWIIFPVERGVLVGLQGVSKPHELFSKEIIEKLKYSPKIKRYTTTGFVTFTFASEGEREEAERTLEAHGIDWQPVSPEMLNVQSSPDRALEILAEKIDTSRIVVERE